MHEGYAISLSDTQKPAEDAVDILKYDFWKLLTGAFVEKLPLPWYIICLAKVGKEICGYRLKAQSYLFIEKLVHGNLTEEDIRKHNDYLKCHSKQKVEELEQLLYMLESHTQKMQTIVLEKLYEAFVKQKIQWEQFCELAELNRRMIVSDYMVLKEIANKIRHTENEGAESRIFKINRLKSLGLVDNASRDAFWKDGGITISTTVIGKQLAEFL